MAQCWRCGQVLNRQGMLYCDRCGASLYWSGGYSAPGWSYEDRADKERFDSRVSTFFLFIGICIIALGMAGAVLMVYSPFDFPGLGILAVGAAIAGLAIGGFFIFLSLKIGEKGRD